MGPFAVWEPQECATTERVVLSWSWSRIAASAHGMEAILDACMPTLSPCCVALSVTVSFLCLGSSCSLSGMLSWMGLVGFRGGFIS